MKRWLLLALLLTAGPPALAQNTLLQGGPTTPGHAPMYVSGGNSQAVVQDSGPAGGGGIGLGLAEQLLTVRGTGTAPYANAGTGPLGENACNMDAPATNPGGGHRLCFSPNALGGGLISYNAFGGAAPLPLQFNINGILTPANGSGIAVGATTVSGGTNSCVFNNNAGLLACSTALPNGTTATAQAASDSSTKVATTSFVQSAITSAISTVCSSIPSTCTLIFGYSNVIWYGADPTDTTDSTAAFNATLVGGKSYWPCGTYKISGSGAQALLMNTPTSIQAAGQNCTTLDINLVAATTNLFGITPTAIRAGLEISGFNVTFATASVPAAQDFINITTSGSTNYIAELNIHDTTVSGTVGGLVAGVGRHALYINNAGANIGGGVFISKFEHNNWVSTTETVYLSQAGDSLHFIGGHYLSTTSRCIFVDLIAGAGNFISDQQNLTCLLGAIRVDSGAAGELLHPLVEQTGTNTGGVSVDFRGGLVKLNGGLILGAQIQEPTSLGGPFPVNIDNADSVILTDSPLIDRFASGTHINVTSNATNLTISPSSNCFVNNTYGACSIANASTTLPKVASGFCATAPAITATYGTSAFDIFVGTSCSGSVGTITMPPATTAWACNFQDVTTPASYVIGQTGGSATTVTLTAYSRTAGTASNFTASDHIRGQCVQY